MIGTLRTTCTPGVSMGTMTMEWRLCGSESARSSVTPSTMANLQFGWAALVMNHLRPLMT
jgi:hypothetical protein